MITAYGMNKQAPNIALGDYQQDLFLGAGTRHHAAF
jgi:hypothetical protein